MPHKQPQVWAAGHPKKIRWEGAFVGVWEGGQDNLDFKAAGWPVRTISSNSGSVVVYRTRSLNLVRASINAGAVLSPEAYFHFTGKRPKYVWVWENKREKVWVTTLVAKKRRTTNAKLSKKHNHNDLQRTQNETRPA